MSSEIDAHRHHAPERIRVVVGPITLTGVLEERRAPATCAAFRALLPLRATLLHVRWSGEAAWVPLGDLALGIGAENAVHEPQPGQLLLFPAGVSETEILVPYGTTRFAARSGPLAGNHFLTVADSAEALREIGRLTLWEGAQPILLDV